MERLGYYNSLINAKEKYGDIVIAKDDFKEVTYSELLSRVDSTYDYLVKMGVKPGDKVGLLGFNCINWLSAYFAIIKLHAIVVCLNYSFTITELNEYIKLTDCNYLLYGSCSGMKKDPEFIKKADIPETNSVCFNDIEFKYKQSFDYVELSDEEYGSPAFIIFTSGTTGKSKGSMLTQKSSLDGAKGFIDAIYEIENETVCVGVPLFHVYGLSMSVSHIMYGGCLYLPSVFSSERILNYLNTYELDSLIGVMTVVIRLLDDPAFNNLGYPSVKRIYTGGAPLMPMQCYRVEKSFGDACLLNCYGQSETDAGITITTPRDSLEQRVDTVGKPCSHRKVFIMGANNQICQTGEKGEIVLLDDGAITKGYYNAPKEVQAIDENGYLHTGDLGYLDEDGYLHLSGRIKDIIIKGGENIVPSDIEKVINELDEIKLVKVMGAMNELYGESIEACVVLNDSFVDKNITGIDLLAKLKDKIPSFKMPSHIFIFDNFPVKPNGKFDVNSLSLMMLDRLTNALIEQDINNGIEILSLKFKKQDYVIATLLKTSSEVLKTVGITDKNARHKIVLSIEEMLTKLVNHSYLVNGSAKIIYTIYKDFLRISFETETSGNLFDSNDDLSIKIIINIVDRITKDDLGNGKVRYNFDYAFPKNYDPKIYFTSIKEV